MSRSTLLLVAAFAFAGASAAVAASELERNRARWEAAGIEDYVYAYQKHCECHGEAPPETVVTVRGTQVARVHHEHAGSEREVPARDGSLDLYWTVDDLFALVANAEAAGGDVRVRYDAEHGFPREVYIDYDASFTGDELDLRVTRFMRGS